MFERWSTPHSTAPQHAESWRAAFLSMTSCADGFADARVVLLHHGVDRLAPGGVDAWVRGSGTRANAAPSCVSIGVHFHGRCRLRQFGRELIARPGELLLIDGGQPYQLQSPDDELLTLIVPQAMLGSLWLSVGELAARRLPESAYSTLLVNQLRTLAQWPHVLNSVEAASVSELLAGMLRTVIAAARSAGAHTPRTAAPKAPAAVE